MGSGQTENAFPLLFPYSAAPDVQSGICEAARLRRAMEDARGAGAWCGVGGDAGRGTTCPGFVAMALSSVLVNGVILGMTCAGVEGPPITQ